MKRWEERRFKYSKTGITRNLCPNDNLSNRAMLGHVFWVCGYARSNPALRFINKKER
jgi:hypothetical protein